MAKFKVGDRVKVVRVSCASVHCYLGQEGIITRPGWILDWCVDFGRPINPAVLAGVPSGCSVVEGTFDENQLVPGITPSVNAWATEAVRKVTKPEPVQPAVPTKTEVCHGQ